ncbi:MAG: SLBB domain-containing protein [Blastocatellia bacterium]|nr:SLBB domain-containing protein [Blastocatellia bacterium]
MLFVVSFTRTIALTILSLCLVCSAPAQDVDLVHHGDLLDVDVLGGLEFDWRGRINPEGFIDGLEGVSEPIPALCRPVSDVAKDIARAYSKFLRNPETVVKIVDKSARPLALIDGAITTPSRLRLNRWPTLREVIVLGGGITGEANGEIQIFRPGNASCGGKDNGPETLSITVKSLLGGAADANPRIRHGDLITIKRADIIYVVGSVVNPGQISSRETTTLSKVIAASGGLAENADSARLSVTRRQGDTVKTTEYDLAKIVKKAVDDPILKAFDVVEVGRKGRAKQTYQPPDAEAPRPALPLRVVD